MDINKRLLYNVNGYPSQTSGLTQQISLIKKRCEIIQPNNVTVLLTVSRVGTQQLNTQAKGNTYFSV